MSKNVLSFPHEGPETSHVPTPVNARPGDTYVRVNLANDKYARTTGFFEGAVLIALAGEIKEGYLHYVELHGRGFLARLSAADDTKVCLVPLDGSTPEGDYRRDALSFVGAVVEIYPRGLGSSRWVLYPAADYVAAQPVVSAVAN